MAAQGRAYDTIVFLEYRTVWYIVNSPYLVVK